MPYLDLTCPYCGEPSDLAVDEDGGTNQSFVHDCPVCCQPWQVTVHRDRDGDWEATARTMDE